MKVDMNSGVQLAPGLKNVAPQTFYQPSQQDDDDSDPGEFDSDGMPMAIVTNIKGQQVLPNGKIRVDTDSDDDDDFGVDSDDGGIGTSGPSVGRVSMK